MGVLDLLKKIEYNEEFYNMLKECEVSKRGFIKVLSRLEILQEELKENGKLVLNARKSDKEDFLWDISCNGKDDYLQLIGKSGELQRIRVNNGDTYCEYIIDYSYPLLCKRTFRINNNALLSVSLLLHFDMRCIDRYLLVRYNDDNKEINIDLLPADSGRMEDDSYLWLVDVFSKIGDKESLSVVELTDELVQALKAKNNRVILGYDKLTIKNKRTGDEEFSRNQRGEKGSYGQLYKYEYSDSLTTGLFGCDFEKNDTSLVVHRKEDGNEIWFDVVIGKAKLMISFSNSNDFNKNLKYANFSHSFIRDIVDYLYNLKWPISMDDVCKNCLEYVTDFNMCSDVSIKLDAAPIHSVMQFKNGKCTYIKSEDEKESVEWKNDGSCRYTVNNEDGNPISIFVDSKSKLSYTGPLDRSSLDGKVLNPVSMDVSQIVATTLEKQEEMQRKASDYSRR